MGAPVCLALPEQHPIPKLYKELAQNLDNEIIRLEK